MYGGSDMGNFQKQFSQMQSLSWILRWEYYLLLTMLIKVQLVATEQCLSLKSYVKNESTDCKIGAVL
jgi:hypothetical protein